MNKRYSLGLDFGTNSVRALLVEVSGGAETATFVWNYQHGKNGVVVSENNPLFARQHPADYVEGTGNVVKGVIKEAKKNDPAFTPDKVIGIGVDTTGSTPIPVDKSGRPLAFNEKFSDNPNSYAWLWKDHTSAEEAEEITAKAKKSHPEYLRRCGGRYSSEWFFAKILHLSRIDRKVFQAAESFVELEDFVPALLADNLAPWKLKRGICAAGHKALYCSRWQGLPSETFLTSLSPNFKGLRGRLYEEAYPAGDQAGRLSRKWAQELGLKEGIAVSVGAFDAHLGAIGAGIGKNGLVKVIGTSACDLMVFPAGNERRLEKIDGMCGLAESSIIPGSIGLEAGQSAVGDIFAWFAENCVPADYSAAANKNKKDIQVYLSEKAARLTPGESGLLALDWNNGNRSVLVDQKLSGLILGQTLATRPEEIYRALIEATGFGARTIIDQIEKSGETIKEIITCGGIPKKNALLMQIYSDILNRPLKIAASEQTCALGAAIVGAVAAGREAGGFADVAEGQKILCRFEAKEYRPDKKSVAAYQKLYRLYSQLHDAFGHPDGCLFSVIKTLEPWIKNGTGVTTAAVTSRDEKVEKMKKIRVGIIGGAGYTGGELLRLLANHAGVEITYVTSETFHGKKITEEYPKLKELSKLTFQSYQKQKVVEACDFVFLAKPHPNSFAMVRELFGKVRIIDLSADFRFPAAQDFERAYQTKHLAPEFLKESVYGLPEIFPQQIKKAKLIANPGCYPTGIILGLFPLFKTNAVEPEISVSAVSGFSGAGRSLSPDSPAYSVMDNIRPYKVGVHPHSAEMEEKIKAATGKKISVNFIPQVAGFERGILSVIFTRLKKKTSSETLVSLYRKTYRKCPFVRLCPQGQYPEIKNVVLTNFCDLGVQMLKDNSLVIIAAIDNLVKGAAGQAIQNLNIMAGFPEKEALR